MRLPVGISGLQAGEDVNFDRASEQRDEMPGARLTRRYSEPRDKTRDLTAWNMIKVSMPKDKFLM
jgi:hypothetical protein